MKLQEQNLKNHVRTHPIFHLVLGPVLLANVGVCIWRLMRSPGFESIWSLILGLAAIAALLLIRIYPLKVQDRVIRTEERMRLARLLPERLRSRIPELTEGQLVALRFAPDEELPALTELTLASNLKGAEIKQKIQRWRPDFFRV